MRMKYFYYAFILAVLTTETVEIEIGGAVAYPYHFFAVIVFFSQIKFIGRLLKSPLFLVFLVFLLFNIVSAILSDDPYSAFLSLSRLAGNMGVAFAVAMLLLESRISVENEYNLILFVTIASIFLALTQILAYSGFGINLGFSESQDEQITRGFGVGFRYEANTFAKYLNFAFLLFIPQIIRVKNNYNYLIALLFIIGMLLSFTRSAQYGLAITLLFIYFWYWSRGLSSLISIKFIVIFIFIGAFLVVYSNYMTDVNQYAMDKISKYFDKEEILKGNSSGLRLDLQSTMISAFLENYKTIFFGNGWGQVFYYYTTGYSDYRKMQAGGAELIVMLGYGGLFVGILYLLYTYMAFSAAKKLALVYKNEKIVRIYEGFMFAIVGSFVTGQINGSLIAAEYWIMIGNAIYFSYKANRLYSISKRSNTY